LWKKVFEKYQMLYMCSNFLVYNSEHCIVADVSVRSQVTPTHLEVT